MGCLREPAYIAAMFNHSKREYAMRRRLDAVRRATPFVSGVLIGTALITPVFAATEVTPESAQPWLLIGSVVVLIVALALQAMTTRRNRQREASDRIVDMRQSETDEGYGAVGDGVYIARQGTGTIGDFRVAPRWR
jgi:cytochrome c biogenesis protein CcdA